MILNQFVFFRRGGSLALSPLVFFLFTPFCFSACAYFSSQKTKQMTPTVGKAEIVVNFTEAQHYFVRNDYADSALHLLKIENQEQLDAVFGIARTMGTGGKATEIDFTTNYVLALIAPLSDNNPSYTISRIGASLNRITVYYSMFEQGKQAFTVRPSKLLVINKQYQGEAALERK